MFFLLGLSAANSATPGTNTTVVVPGPIAIKTNYYVFGGTNAVEMRQAMTEARPWKQTMAYDAHTKWDVRADYRSWRTNGEYRIQSVEVSTKVDVTLPLWIPGKPVSRELVAQWQRCIAGLTAHELGHVQLAQAAGAEVKKKLTNLPSYSSAQELKAGADATVADTITVFQERERKYDEVTGHGRTQGAIFPVDWPRRRSSRSAE